MPVMGWRRRRRRRVRRTQLQALEGPDEKIQLHLVMEGRSRHSSVTPARGSKPSDAIEGRSPRTQRKVQTPEDNRLTTVAHPVLRNTTTVSWIRAPSVVAVNTLALLAFLLINLVNVCSISKRKLEKHLGCSLDEKKRRILA